MTPRSASDWWSAWLVAIAGAVVAAGVVVIVHATGPEDGPAAVIPLALASSAIALITAVIIIMLYERRLSRLRVESESLAEGRAESLLQSRGAVILGLAKLAESRDDETGQHLDRIRRYVRILGEAMIEGHDEVDRDFVETVVETSALHDIGKVGIPDHVLLKPGLLTEDQREIIKKHTLIGGDTLLAVKRRWGDDQFLVTACEIVFAHHERYDGTGYPFGLAGEMIPLAARIVAVADVYDALTNARVYKDAMEHSSAVAVIDEGRGSHFDPRVVDAFLSTEAEFRIVAEEFDKREREPMR